jgi:hypothetical protein
MKFNERTLYHGTIIDNEPSIRQFGLVGGWHGPIGSFVDDAYGSDYENIEPTEEDEIVFAADKNNLNKAVNAMVHHIGKKLNKNFHDVSDNDIRNHGLLVIIKDSELEPHDQDKYQDNIPRGVEPGDYYDSQMGADLFLRGSSLIRFLRNKGQWPRTWGTNSGNREKITMGKTQASWMQNKTNNNQKIIKFKEWINQNTVGTDLVDSSQIERLYDKAKLSVKIVQIYSKTTNQNLLKNISTIAPLAAGVYGMYMSKENKRVIGKETAEKMRLLFPKDMMLQQKLQTLPNAVIKKYVPDVDDKQLQPTDTIRVNVKKIVDKLGDSKEAVLEIASTIVHEATHEVELQTTGKTNEIGPKNAEAKFIQWANQNWNMLRTRIPELSNL